MTASACREEEDDSGWGVDGSVAFATSSAAAKSLELVTPGLAMLWLTMTTREPTIGAIGGQSNGATRFGGRIYETSSVTRCTKSSGLYSSRMTSSGQLFRGMSNGRGAMKANR